MQFYLLTYVDSVIRYEDASISIRQGDSMQICAPLGHGLFQPNRTTTHCYRGHFDHHFVTSY